MEIVPEGDSVTVCVAFIILRGSVGGGGGGGGGFAGNSRTCPPWPPELGPPAVGPEC